MGKNMLVEPVEPIGIFEEGIEIKCHAETLGEVGVWAKEKEWS